MIDTLIMVSISSDLEARGSNGDLRRSWRSVLLLAIFQHTSVDGNNQLCFSHAVFFASRCCTTLSFYLPSTYRPVASVQCLEVVVWGCCRKKENVGISFISNRLSLSL